jgi:hypothetical protein
MAARNVPGLYAIGEAVDTGWLGGYNFQRPGEMAAPGRDFRWILILRRERASLEGWPQTRASAISRHSG